MQSGQPFAISECFKKRKNYQKHEIYNKFTFTTKQCKLQFNRLARVKITNVEIPRVKPLRVRLFKATFNSLTRKTYGEIIQRQCCMLVYITLHYGTLLYITLQCCTQLNYYQTCARKGQMCEKEGEPNCCHISVSW